MGQPISERVKRLWTKRGLPERDLSKRAGVAGAHINLVALGKRIVLHVPSRSVDALLLGVGIGVMFWFLNLTNTVTPSPYLYTLQTASATLQGTPPAATDVATAIAGFRRLYLGLDTYPALGLALADYGINWDVKHASTHPPTAFLLVAPVSFLPWDAALTVWAWLMVILLFATLVSMRLSWWRALALTPVLLLWPPVATSLGQITIIWMFALAMAYRLSKEHPSWSGLWIGIGAMTKLTPGVMMIAFILQKRWRALIGFALAWSVALATIVILNPSAILRYIEVNKSNMPVIIQREDNASLLVAGYRWAGWLGILAVTSFFLVIIVVNRRLLLSERAVISAKGWMLLSYFAVALLPIFWIYSLLPLLPVMVFLVSQKKIITTLIVALCVFIPCISPPWGVEAVGPLVAVNVLVGLAFILDALDNRATNNVGNIVPS